MISKEIQALVDAINKCENYTPTKDPIINGYYVHTIKLGKNLGEPKPFVSFMPENLELKDYSQRMNCQHEITETEFILLQEAEKDWFERCQEARWNAFVEKLMN